MILFESKGWDGDLFTEMVEVNLTGQESRGLISLTLSGRQHDVSAELTKEQALKLAENLIQLALSP